MGIRRKARELALQVLYQSEYSEQSIGVAFDLFCTNFEAGKKSIPYARDLAAGIEQNKEKIDTLISEHAANWRPERMSLIDRNILRIAVFEICFQAEVPARVVINEAIEVSKRYGTEESGPFINGILDAVRMAVEKQPLS